jgi:hypothetical protein
MAKLYLMSAAPAGRCLERPIGPDDRHDHLVSVCAAEVSIPTRNALCQKSDLLIGSCSSPVVRKDAKANPVGIGYLEDVIDQLGKKPAAESPPGILHRNPLDQRNTIRRRPIANNCKPGRSIRINGQKVRVASVGHGGAMALLIPAADDGIIAWEAFRSHHERNIRFACTYESQRFHPVRTSPSCLCEAYKGASPVASGLFDLAANGEITVVRGGEAIAGSFTLQSRSAQFSCPTIVNDFASFIVEEFCEKLSRRLQSSGKNGAAAA